MLRVALAGFSQGYYAVNYLRYLARLKEVRVVGVSDLGRPEEYVRECAFVTAQAFAAEMGAPLLREYEDLLALEPDAVLICSETVEHVPMALEAARRGIHAFVSKPLCFSYAQAREIARLPGRKACVLCGNPLKYELGVEEMKERLERDEIGRVYSLRVMVNHEAMVHQEWERDASRSGGPLGTYGVYLFDLARYVAGISLQTVYALGMNAATPQIDGPDTVKVLGSAPGFACTLELFSGLRAPYPFLQLEAVGQGGTLTARYENYATFAQTARGEKTGSLRLGDMTAGEMEHFLACVKGEAAPRCSLEDMAYVTRCLEAVRESLATARPAKVPEEESECETAR